MTVRAEAQIDLARVDDGAAGQNGATFTPSVDVAGDISWTNDGGLPNPPTQNIMGPQGDPGTPGTNGVSVTAVEPQYYLSTSDSSATGGSWSSTPATFVSGCYYWTRDYITFSDGTHDTSTEVYNAGMTQAAQDAYDALTLADDTNQYFWYAPTGADTGAHITEVPQDEWNDISDPNYHSGGNLLARTNGIAVRDGMTELATFGASGAEVYMNGDSVALLGSTTRVGSLTSGSNVQVKTDGLYLSGYKNGQYFSDYGSLGMGSSGDSVALTADSDLSMISTTGDTYITSTVGALFLQSDESFHFTSGTGDAYFDCDQVIIDAKTQLKSSLFNWDEYGNEYMNTIGYTSSNNHNLVVGSSNYGENASGYNVYVEGYNVYLRSRNKCYSDGGVISTSDKRLKKNIKDVKDIDEFFMQLRPVEYKRKESADTDTHFGMIAQDVEETAKKCGIDLSQYALVDEWENPDDEEKYKTLAYTEFIPMCIYMIQKQQKEIEELKSIIKDKK